MLKAEKRGHNSLALKQVSTLLQRILLRAKRKPCPENQSPGSESWSVLCTGGSAGAALCVEDVAVLRDDKNKQCCIIVVYWAVVFDGWLTDERFLHIL